MPKRRFNQPTASDIRTAQNRV